MFASRHRPLFPQRRRRRWPGPVLGLLVLAGFLGPFGENPDPTVGMVRIGPPRAPVAAVAPSRIVTAAVDAARFETRSAAE